MSSKRVKAGAESLSGSFRIRNLTYEMYNDAMYFKEQAKKLPTEPKYDFQRWTYLRASIIVSLIAIESFINLFLKQHFNYLDVSTQSCLFVGNNGKPKASKLRRLPIDVKLTMGIKLVTGKTFDVTKEPYKSYKRFKKIRNDLVHFEGTSKQDRKKHNNDFTIDNAENVLKTIRSMMKKIHKFEDATPPEWIRQTRSAVIK
ncbi:hypothetical protein ACFLQ6_09050 [Thermoproteota archaeon]